MRSPLPGLPFFGVAADIQSVTCGVTGDKYGYFDTFGSLSTAASVVELVEVVTARVCALSESSIGHHVVAVRRAVLQHSIVEWRAAVEEKTVSQQLVLKRISKSDEAAGAGVGTSGSHQ